MHDESVALWSAKYLDSGGAVFLFFKIKLGLRAELPLYNLNITQPVQIKVMYRAIDHLDGPPSEP
jgi:hypothetical protein